METTQTLQMRFVTQAGTRVTISLTIPRMTSPRPRLPRQWTR